MNEAIIYRGQQEIEMTDRTHGQKKRIEEHFKIDLGMTTVIRLYIKQPIGYSWIEYQNNTGMYSS